MTTDLKKNPGYDPAALDDEAVLKAHEKLLGPQPDDKGHYRFLPLIALLIMSGCVLFAATYLNRYSGHFDSMVYNENLLPVKGGPVEVKIDPVALGNKLFHTSPYCVTCHQANGEGIPGVYPPLAGSSWVNGPEDRIIRILLDGLKGPVTVEGKTFNSAVMPSFGSAGFNFSDEKIAAVLTYVRQEWGNKAPAVSPDTVAKIRQEVGGHKEWTADELMQVK